MLIFHEGLPGSGKSYEACINRIIPALKERRKVYAYIEGLNHAKFAEVTGISEEDIKTLLFQITKEQVPTIASHVPNDCLVIIDELQDFFPAGRDKLTPEITEFVTQHRHRGIDIVAMGQDHRDCHMLWKRRIDQLITFTKRDAIGRSGEYTWSTFKANAGKFVKLRSGKGTYDKKYFGLYASHVANAKNTDTYTDDRSNIFKSNAFKYYLPIFGIVFIFSIYKLVTFFTDSPVALKQAQAPKTETKTVTRHIEAAPPVAPPLPVSTPEPAKKEYDDYLQKYLTEYRPRLAALIESADKKRIYATVEFNDSSNHVFEKLNIPQIQAFGYEVERKPYGLLLKKNKKEYPVTAYPVEKDERITRHPSDESNGNKQEQTYVEPESFHAGTEETKRRDDVDDRNLYNFRSM